MSAIFWQLVARHWRGLIDVAVFTGIASSGLSLLALLIAGFAGRDRPKGRPRPVVTGERTP